MKDAPDPQEYTINRRHIGSVFEHDLKDWEEAINSYLYTGTAVRHR